MRYLCRCKSNVVGSVSSSVGLCLSKPLSFVQTSGVGVHPRLEDEPPHLRYTSDVSHVSRVNLRHVSIVPFSYLPPVVPLSLLCSQDSYGSGCEVWYLCHSTVWEDACVPSSVFSFVHRSELFLSRPFGAPRGLCASTLRSHVGSTLSRSRSFQAHAPVEMEAMQP